MLPRFIFVICQYLKCHGMWPERNKAYVLFSSYNDADICTENYRLLVFW